jgi:AcrR family transcriptional regulator
MTRLSIRVIIFILFVLNDTILVYLSYLSILYKMENRKTSRRESLITAGKEMFLKHGFRRVSIDDLCAKAGISKMTFYRYFPNKTELAKTVYRTILDDGYLKFRSVMDEDSSPEEKIHKMLMYKLEGTDQISQEFLVDFYTSREAGLKDFVDSATKELWQGMISDFRAAQQKGIFRLDFDPGFFFIVMQKITGSLDDPEITKMFDSPQAMIMELVSLLIYGIVPKN